MSLMGLPFYVPPGVPADAGEYARDRERYRACGSTPLVARSTLNTAHGAEAVVSTVFLGIDHGWGMSSTPILWETMIFGVVLDLEQWRYATPQDAARGHAHAVRLAQMELDLAGRPALVTLTYRGFWHPA